MPVTALRFRRYNPAMRLALIFLLPVLATLSVSAQEQDGLAQDSETGLIMASGWEAVRATCTECHSAQLITQNSGTDTVWLTRIRWMQSTQGLRELEPDLEATIIDYLSTHYGQRESGRRPPLPAEFLPPNPYATDN